jgi:hypothetical protein
MIGYPNVSKVLDVEPQAAAAAFDVMILDPAIAADLELLRWSNSPSELAIHTMQHPGLLADRNVAAYLRAATRSLGTLAELLGTAREMAEPVTDRWNARVPVELVGRVRALPEPCGVARLIN